MATAGSGALGGRSAAELADLLARRELSALELAEDFLASHERLNPLLNAIVAIDPDAARTQARASDARRAAGWCLGPLDGIPVTVKDNLFVAGFPATWGSRLHQGFRPDVDDIGIARLRAAGANLIAKTNTPEFALAAHTDNLVFGASRNPWNLGLTPGGSSGGAVAALAAGMGPLAVGTDAGGSIRRPASYAGVVGFRPSTGRIPRVSGFPALAHDFQVVAPAARTVDDAYLLFRAMAGADRRDHASLCFADTPLPEQLSYAPLPRSRIRCVFGIGDAPVDRDVRDSVQAAALTFASMGHDVEEVSPPYELQEVERIWSTLSTAGVARALAPYADWQERVTPATRAAAERGQTVPVQEYIAALDAVRQLRVRMATFFEKADILLTPTSASLPWRLGEPFPSRINGREAGPRGAALFATFVNAAALPAISVPVAPSADGLPVGMQLVGPFGADVALLGLARSFEEAVPWRGRFPALA
jgi:aspartyl-tRNA(Asn)/glutamyl-tRNA(Gln) amidotransferase subunit A